ncbi:MAG TPA: hypothetical protein VMS98_08305, partial [Thermoanaerobaculia bacterium]|nr:hypothetical protein [Thermoanaerobaculia bacterium]
MIGGLVFAITSVGGLALAGLVVVAIPADYFSRSQGPRFMAGKHPLLRWAAVVLKNLAGVIIVALGIVLAMPGVPGPGLLTIVIGLMLLDFPGKIRLERWLVNRSGVLRTINRL